MSKNKILSFRFFFIVNLIIISSVKTYIIYDLKTFYNNSADYSTPENFISSTLSNILYTELLFGEPPRSYVMQIKTDDYGFYLFNHNCYIPPLTEFDTSLSKTSLIEYGGKDLVLLDEQDIYMIEDNITLNEINDNNINNNDNNKIHQIKAKVDIFYGPRNRTEETAKIVGFNKNLYTCFIMGLHSPSRDFEFFISYFMGFINQLKDNKVINSYDWFIEYDNKNKDIAKLIIGISPHEYNKEKYTEINSRKINEVIMKYIRIFNLMKFI